jgi:ABC-2 type transport system ATP-binding protein
MGMNDNNLVLSINNLVKYYGTVKALDNVSYTIPKGAVFGILGPNGSGKTTTLGIVLNILNKTAGSFSWFGSNNNIAVRKQIGSLLETPNFYHYLSAVDNLKITQSISGRGTEKDIHEVLEIVNLDKRKFSKFSTYSLGMKQRLAIAAALLGNPNVLVLDEPTNGLDPMGIAEIRTLIKQLANQGKTIIMASHILDEVEKVCTHVAIMNKGKLITAGPVNDVLVNEDIVEVAAANMPQLQQLMSNYPQLQKLSVEDSFLALHFNIGQANLADINTYCFNNGIVLHRLNSKRKSLEAKFFELTAN